MRTRGTRSRTRAAQKSMGGEEHDGTEEEANREREASPVRKGKVRNATRIATKSRNATNTKRHKASDDGSTVGTESGDQGSQSDQEGGEEGGTISAAEDDKGESASQAEGDGSDDSTVEEPPKSQPSKEVPIIRRSVRKRKRKRRMGDEGSQNDHLQGFKERTTALGTEDEAASQEGSQDDEGDIEASEEGSRTTKSQASTARKLVSLRKKRTLPTGKSQNIVTKRRRKIKESADQPHQGFESEQHDGGKTAKAATVSGIEEDEASRGYGSGDSNDVEIPESAATNRNRPPAHVQTSPFSGKGEQKRDGIAALTKPSGRVSISRQRHCNQEEIGASRADPNNSSSETNRSEACKKRQAKGDEIAQEKEVQDISKTSSSFAHAKSIGGTKNENGSTSRTNPVEIEKKNEDINGNGVKTEKSRNGIDDENDFLSETQTTSLDKSVSGNKDISDDRDGAGCSDSECRSASPQHQHETKDKTVVNKASPRRDPKIPLNREQAHSQKRQSINATIKESLEAPAQDIGKETSEKPTEGVSAEVNETTSQAPLQKGAGMFDAALQLLSQAAFMKRGTDKQQTRREGAPPVKEENDETKETAAEESNEAPPSMDDASEELACNEKIEPDENDVTDNDEEAFLDQVGRPVVVEVTNNIDNVTEVKAEGEKDRSEPTTVMSDVEKEKSPQPHAVDNNCVVDSSDPTNARTAILNEDTTKTDANEEHKSEVDTSDSKHNKASDEGIRPSKAVSEKNANNPDEGSCQSVEEAQDERSQNSGGGAERKSPAAEKPAEMLAPGDDLAPVEDNIKQPSLFDNVNTSVEEEEKSLPQLAIEDGDKGTQDENDEHASTNIETTRLSAPQDEDGTSSVLAKDEQGTVEKLHSPLAVHDAVVNEVNETALSRIDENDLKTISEESGTGVISDVKTRAVSRMPEESVTRPGADSSSDANVHIKEEVADKTGITNRPIALDPGGREHKDEAKQDEEKHEALDVPNSGEVEVENAETDAVLPSEGNLHSDESGGIGNCTTEEKEERRNAEESIQVDNLDENNCSEEVEAKPVVEEEESSNISADYSEKTKKKIVAPAEEGCKVTFDQPDVADVRVEAAVNASSCALGNDVVKGETICCSDPRSAKSQNKSDLSPQVEVAVKKGSSPANEVHNEVVEESASTEVPQSTPSVQTEGGIVGSTTTHLREGSLTAKPVKQKSSLQQVTCKDIQMEKADVSDEKVENATSFFQVTSSQKSTSEELMTKKADFSDRKVEDSLKCIGTPANGTTVAIVNSELQLAPSPEPNLINTAPEILDVNGEKISGKIVPVVSFTEPPTAGKKQDIVALVDATKPSPKPSTENELRPEVEVSAKNRKRVKKNASYSTLKMRIFEEAINVHGRDRADRLFLAYWDTLSARVSDTFKEKKYVASMGHIRKKSESFESFLSTRRLRKMHNKLILAFIEHSLQDVASDSKLHGTVPSSWRKRLRIVRVREKTEAQARQDRARASRGSATLGGARKTKTIDKEIPILTTSKKYPPAFEVRPTLSGASMKEAWSSDCIPGAFAVDPVVRGQAKEQKIEVSEEAIWLSVVAVREFVTLQVKLLISSLRAQRKNEIVPSAALVTPVLHNGKGDTNSSQSLHQTLIQMTHRMEQPDDLFQHGTNRLGRITSSDIATYLSNKPFVGGSIGSAASRLVFDRSRSSGGTRLCISPKMELLQSCFISELAKTREQKMNTPSLPDISASPLPHAVGLLPNKQEGLDSSTVDAQSQTVTAPVEPTLSNSSSVLPSEGSGEKSKLQSAIKPGGLGRGAKDLSMMRRRVSSSGIGAEKKEESKEKQFMTTSTAPTVIPPSNVRKGPEARPSTASTLASQGAKPIESIRPVSAPAGARGRGFGTKNLAALKARSSSSQSAAPPTKTADAPSNEMGSEVRIVVTQSNETNDLSVPIDGAAATVPSLMPSQVTQTSETPNGEQVAK